MTTALRLGGVQGGVTLVDDDAPHIDWILQRSWHVSNEGYVFANVPVAEVRQWRTSKVLLHRVLTGCAKGDKRRVAHLNGNRLDNRMSNLEVR